MVIIFESADVFDGVCGELSPGTSVLVEDNQIKEVSSQPIQAANALRIDCRGKTLMPGLIDCHVHIYLESLCFNPEPPVTYRAQYARNFLTNILACGFTAVRDVAGGDHGMAMALRAGYFDGPRFFYGGLCLTQTGGHGDMRLMSQETDFDSCGVEHNIFAVRADGVDACIKAAREELRKGASHIKIMGSGGVLSPTDPLDRCQYSEAEIRAIVDECTRHGSYVCAHCHPTEAVRRCVEYGVRSIEHGTLIDDATALFVAERGAFVVPTLACRDALMKDGAVRGMSAASLEKLSRVHERGLASLEIMKRAGVKMGFGTDLLGTHYQCQGSEFALRAQVLQPIDILRSATSVNAEILQMEGRLGVIRPGAFADLLIVDGNPLEDIHLLAANGRHLTHIIVDGRLVKQPA